VIFETSRFIGRAVAALVADRTTHVGMDNHFSAVNWRRSTALPTSTGGKSLKELENMSDDEADAFAKELESKYGR
jgi:hypothetical protein